MRPRRNEKRVPKLNPAQLDATNGGEQLTGFESDDAYGEIWASEEEQGIEVEGLDPSYDPALGDGFPMPYANYHDVSADAFSGTAPVSPGMPGLEVMQAAAATFPLIETIGLAERAEELSWTPRGTGVVLGTGTSPPLFMKDGPAGPLHLDRLTNYHHSGPVEPGERVDLIGPGGVPVSIDPDQLEYFPYVFREVK